MKIFNLFKKNRANNSGQGLAEISVFGALLLMAFGFLIRYGLQYNYSQQVKMEAFRRSLKLAYDSDVAKSQDVIVVKDVHIPNPQDMFVQGDRQAIKASAGVLWNNGSQSADYSSTELKPTVKYIFNPDTKFSGSSSPYKQTSGTPSEKDVIVKEFTTSELTAPQGGSVLEATRLILKGVTTPYTISSYSTQSKVYQQDEGYGGKEVMVLMSSAVDCNKQYCPKDLVEKVQFSTTVPLYLRYFPIFNVTGDAGQPPQTITFVDSEAGEINSTYSAMQTENTVNNKHDRLILDEDSTARNSRDILDETENVTHVIITRGGDKSPTFVFKNEASKPWTTPK
jgi:hypothetical protein